MQTLISIIIALIIFSVLVLIHEFGHFIVAKKCGVVVNEFSVGMGPRLLSRVAKSGTRYSIKALPLGGSCAMLGEDEDNAEEGSFNSKPLWARMASVAGIRGGPDLWTRPAAAGSDSLFYKCCNRTMIVC